MSLETLEFIIYPDGRVRETVTGIVGTSCEAVTQAIEAQLGKVVSQEKTAEFYQPNAIAQDQSIAYQSQQSDW